MREKTKAVIIFLVLAVIGLFVAGIQIFGTGFTFSHASLNVEQRLLVERLEYTANKPYHTLYRNFVTPVSFEAYVKPSIVISKVRCSEGEAYTHAGGSCFKFAEGNYQEYCPYTEPNEYGCTFGDTYGFSEGADYWIEGEYEVVPDTLFLIGGKYYKKFVAYSAGNHPALMPGYNLEIIGEAEYKKLYSSNEDVVIYLPYEGSIEGFKVVNKSGFSFGYLRLLLVVLAGIIPAVIFFLVWHFFGKENEDIDTLNDLSYYPNERKGWEVAAYFNPPFSNIDKNFFSAILLDLYHRKIIDTKMVDKEVYVKIVRDDDPSLDEVEKNFVAVLNKIKESAPEKYKDGEFFNLKKASGTFRIQSTLSSAMRLIDKDVKKKGKEYQSTTAQTILSVSVIAFGIFMALEASIFGQLMTFWLVGSAVLMIIISSYSALLIKFEKNYYREYIQWQAFKSYLSKSHSIRTLPHKGVVLWDKYLVYASALGVAKKVIKELKELKIIDDRQYNLYMGSYTMSSSFASHSGAGAGGGVGGGGAGGGGGGGR
jgi:hypothetical protein